MLNRVPTMPNAIPPAGVLPSELGSALKGRFTRFPPVDRPVAAATGSSEASDRFGFTGAKLLLGAIPARPGSVAEEKPCPISVVLPALCAAAPPHWTPM